MSKKIIKHKRLIEDWLYDLENKAEAYYGKRYLNYDYTVNKKYTKIFYKYPDGKRAVHAFLDNETLDVLKANSWKKPAKDPRYNLIKDFATILAISDPIGRYLKKRL